LLDPIAGFRGRFKGISSSQVNDLSGRSATNTLLMNLPDEALDQSALNAVSELLASPEQKAAFDSLKDAVTKKNGSLFEAGMRPVTAVREQSLPKHICDLVDCDAHGDHGTDVGQKRALEITARLARESAALEQQQNNIVRERKRIELDAAQYLRRDRGELSSDEVVDALIPSVTESMAEDYLSVNLRTPAFAILQKKYMALLQLSGEIDKRQVLTQELQQKFLLAAAPENSRITIVAQAQKLLSHPELKKFANEEFKHSGTRKSDSLEQLEADRQAAPTLQSSLKALSLKNVQISDLQGKVHTLGQLVNQESVSGVIHKANQRTLCGVSGTTTDLMLALTAEYGPDAVSELLRSFWDYSDPNPSAAHSLSSKSKQLLTSISVFMQRGNYHTPAEVAGGLLVAAGAVLDMKEAQSMPDMTARYHCLLAKMSADPAGLFIEDGEQQAYFRSRLSETAERLFSAPAAETPMPLKVSAETKQAPIASAPVELISEPKPASVVFTPVVPPAAQALTQSHLPQTVADAQRSVTRFAELMQLPQALDYQDALRKAEESELANALGPLQGYEASRQQFEIVKESVNALNKTLKDLIASTISDSLEISNLAKFELHHSSGHLDYPELGVFSEAINSLSAGFVLVGSALTVAQNIQKNKVLLPQIANLRQSLGSIKPIFEAHSELQAIRQQKQNDLEIARRQATTDGAAENQLLDNTNKIQILEAQVVAIDRTLPRLAEFVANHQAQLVLNENKLSALEHKVRLTTTSTVLAGFSAVKAPTAVIKDALTFSGSATASTVGKVLNVVFLPLTIAKTIHSSINLGFAAHEATKIGWKRDRLKEVQAQLQLGLNASNKEQNPRENSASGNINPGNLALNRLLTASLDSLRVEKYQKRIDGLADGLDVVAGVISATSSVIAAVGLGLSTTVVGAPLGLPLAGAGALLGVAGAGCVLGVAYWRNRRAKKNKNQLHDAQVGLSNLQNGISLVEVAKKNPFVANLVKIETKRLRAEQTAQSSAMSSQERDARVKQAVLEQCAKFIEDKHHNFNANLTCSALNDELRDMASRLAKASANSAVMQELEPEQRALLQRLVQDRPASLVGVIPAPDTQNPLAQQQYFELVQKLISVSEGINTNFATEYPVAAALSVLALDTGFRDRDLEYGAQGIASIYYAGTRKNAADTLLVMLGVAPLPVAEASAEAYFKTSTGFAAASSSNGLGTAARESGAAAVLQILRKHRDLRENVMASADQAANSNKAAEAFAKVPPVGEMATRPHLNEAIEQLQAFAQPRVSESSNTQPLAPTALVRDLVTKVGKGNSYIELGRSDVDFRESFRSRRRGQNNGSQFVRGLEKKFKSYGNETFTGPLFVGIRRKTDERDRHQFHLSVDPQATCQTKDGRVCTPDFLICNRAGIGSRADYVTYDRVGSQWYLSTSAQRIDISLDPEIIRQKISALTTPVAEKMLYIQIQRDIADNCELVGFEVAPTLAQAKPTVIPSSATELDDDLVKLLPGT